MNNDQEHLRYLTIGFYVYAGIMAVVSIFPIIHVVIGVMIATGSFESGNNPPPPVMGYLFAGIGATIIFLGLTIATMNLLAGRFLSGRKKYMFCFVIAAIDCMFAPVGTILGVFTIIVLLRDSVKELFNVAPKEPSLS